MQDIEDRVFVGSESWVNKFNQVQSLIYLLSDNIFFSMREACLIATFAAGVLVIGFNITKSCMVP
jgi:hypothetical protein